MINGKSKEMVVQAKLLTTDVYCLICVSEWVHTRCGWRGYVFVIDQSISILFLHFS